MSNRQNTKRRKTLAKHKQAKQKPDVRFADVLDVLQASMRERKLDTLAGSDKERKEQVGGIIHTLENNPLYLDGTKVCDWCDELVEGTDKTRQQARNLPSIGAGNYIVKFRIAGILSLNFFYPVTLTGDDGQPYHYVMNTTVAYNHETGKFVCYPCRGVAHIDVEDKTLIPDPEKVGMMPYVPDNLEGMKRIMQAGKMDDLAGSITFMTRCTWWTVAFSQQASVELRDVPRTKKAEKWREASKVPLVRQQIVDIGPTAKQVEDRASSSKDGNGRRRGVARHVCRGHWRMGTTWIPAHWRGDLKYGLVKKEYNVAPFKQ